MFSQFHSFVAHGVAWRNVVSTLEQRDRAKMKEAGLRIPASFSLLTPYLIGFLSFLAGVFSSFCLFLGLESSARTVVVIFAESTL